MSTTGQQTRSTQLAFPLKASDTTLHLHLTIYARTLILIIATKASDTLHAALLEASNQPQSTESSDSQPTTQDSVSLGSFVVGMPDLMNPAKPSPSTTPLYTDPHSLDLCTRLCRMLTTKLQRAGEARQVYVGVCGGVRFWGPEEEAEVGRGVVQVVTGEVEG